MVVLCLTSITLMLALHLKDGFKSTVVGSHLHKTELTIKTTNEAIL